MKKIIQFIILIVFGLTCNAQPGTLDMSFNPGDSGNGNGDGVSGIGGFSILATQL
jgi:hypothetical protein